MVLVTFFKKWSLKIWEAIKTDVSFNSINASSINFWFSSFKEANGSSNKINLGLLYNNRAKQILLASKKQIFYIDTFKFTHKFYY